MFDILSVAPLYVRVSSPSNVSEPLAVTIRLSAKFVTLEIAPSPPPDPVASVPLIHFEVELSYFNT